MEIVVNVIYEAWEVLLQSAPFMLFGFFIAGLLKAFVGTEFVSRNLGSGKTSDVIKASVLGVPIPLCSCGVIPAAAQLRQQGASKGATASFLISTPETGVDSIAVTYALLDPVMAFFRPFAAFLTAMVAGILVDRSEKSNGSGSKLIPDAVLLPHTHGHDHDCGCSSSTEKCACTEDEKKYFVCGESHCGCGGHAHTHNPDSLVSKIRGGMEYAFGDLLQDIGIWFLGGVLLAGIFGALVPDGFIEKHLGGGFLPMLIMLVAAIPLYVCATASTPIAAALALKGLSPGAALVFLLAGPATNAASFTVVARLLGKRAAVIYLGAIVGCSLLMGTIVNWIYYALGLNIADWVQSGPGDEHGTLYIVSTLILLALIIVPKVSALIKGRGRFGHSH